jgi:hypothetical protein
LTFSELAVYFFRFWSPLAKNKKDPGGLICSDLILEEWIYGRGERKEVSSSPQGEEFFHLLFKSGHTFRDGGRRRFGIIHSRWEYRSCREIDRIVTI